METANPNEYNVYFVEEIQRNNIKGYQIILKSNDLNKEVIFGMDSDEAGQSKAWLDYICLRLNRAFVNGWFAAKGVSSWPDKGYYEELDRLFKIMKGL